MRNGTELNHAIGFTITKFPEVITPDNKTKTYDMKFKTPNPK